jgi:hypothetical protein
MDACSRRYGSPVSRDGQIYTYRMGDIQIRILFGGFSGKQAVALRYSKPVDGANQEMSAEEIRTMLSVNTKGSGRGWTELDPWSKGYYNMSELERSEAANRDNAYLEWSHSEIKALATYKNYTDELYIHLKDVDMQDTSSAISGL